MDRLVLRKLHHEDFPSLIKYANNKKISDQIVNVPFPYSDMDAILRFRFIKEGLQNKSRYIFAIIHKEESELIGEISLHFHQKNVAHAQLAYWLAEPFWNQGITTEAAKAIIEFGFGSLNTDLIYADCYSTNLASEKVLQKCNFSFHKKTGNILLYVLKNKTKE